MEGTMVENNKAASLRDFLYVVFNHKTKILTVFLATVITVTAGSFIIKPTYEANSNILIKFGRENIYTPATADGSIHIVSLNRQEEIDSEIEILKSRNLIERTIRTLGVETIYPELLKKGIIEKTMETSGIKAIYSKLFKKSKSGHKKETLTPFDKAVLMVQKKLDIEGVKKSDVIHVKFQYHDPHIAASVVNTMVNFYLDQHLDVHKNPGEYGFFKEQVTIAENRLESSEQALEEFKDRHRISSLDQQKTLILRQASGLQAVLEKTQRQIDETQNKINEIKTQLAGNPLEITVGMEMDRNPHVIASLREKLIELQSTEQQLLTKYREDSRTVQNKHVEIGNVKKSLAKEELKIYQTDLRALRTREASQKAHLAGYQKEINKLNDLEMQLRRLKRQRDTDEKNYQLYLTKLEESRISDTMDMEKMANVSVIQAALVPLEPVKPKKLLNIILAIILGTAGSLGLAFFSEFMDHSFTTGTDFEEKLGMPLLASIQEFKPLH
jgi:uncharacterized protein involved in exopolysaccharide biosynthesis